MIKLTEEQNAQLNRQDDLAISISAIKTGMVNSLFWIGKGSKEDAAESLALAKQGVERLQAFLEQEISDSDKLFAEDMLRRQNTSITTG